MNPSQDSDETQNSHGISLTQFQFLLDTWNNNQNSFNELFSSSTRGSITSETVTLLPQDRLHFVPYVIDDRQFNFVLYRHNDTTPVVSLLQ